MRRGVLALAFVLLAPAAAVAEWQIKPFLGITFGGGTTFVDFEGAAGKPNFAYGATVALLGEAVGIEVDFGRAPGFFESGSQDRVRESNATTLTGNIVITVPRSVAAYTLRPYFVGGAGLMRARSNNFLPGADVLVVASNLPAMDLGGGVTGFLTDRIGFNWELRHFRSVGGSAERGPSFGAERLSFWRAHMALAIRY